MPDGDQYHAQHQYICYFSEFPASKFTQVSGGEAQNDVSQQFPGGQQAPQNIVGPTTVSQVSLQKPYDHVVDQPLDQWAAAWDRGVHQELTLIKQPVNSEGVPAGKATTFIGCAKQSYKEPDLETGSSEAAMLEITVQPRKKE